MLLYQEVSGLQYIAILLILIIESYLFSSIT